jgi:hypothetical protein
MAQIADEEFYRIFDYNIEVENGRDINTKIVKI